MDTLQFFPHWIILQDVTMMVAEGVPRNAWYAQWFYSTVLEVGSRVSCSGPREETWSKGSKKRMPLPEGETTLAERSGNIHIWSCWLSTFSHLVASAESLMACCHKHSALEQSGYRRYPKEEPLLTAFSTGPPSGPCFLKPIGDPLPLTN